MEDLDAVYRGVAEWKPPPPSEDGRSTVSGAVSCAEDLANVEHDRPWSTATKAKRGPTGKILAIWDEQLPSSSHRGIRSTTIKDGECKRIVGEFRKLHKFVAGNTPGREEDAVANNNNNNNNNNSPILANIDVTSPEAFCKLCVRAITALRSDAVNVDHVRLGRKKPKRTAAAAAANASLRVAVRDYCVSVLRLVHIEALNVASSRREKLRQKHSESARHLCATHAGFSLKDSIVARTTSELVVFVREFALSSGRTALGTGARANTPRDDSNSDDEASRQDNSKLAWFRKCAKTTCIRALQHASANPSSGTDDEIGLHSVSETARMHNVVARFATERSLIPTTSSAPLSEIVQRRNVREAWGQLASEDKDREAKNWNDVLDAVTAQARLDSLMTSVEEVLGVGRSWFAPYHQHAIVRIQAAWRAAVVKARMPVAQRDRLKARAKAVHDRLTIGSTESSSGFDADADGNAMAASTLRTIPDPPPEGSSAQPQLFQDLLPCPRPPGAEAMMFSANAVLGLLQPTLNERFEGYVALVWQILTNTRSWIVTQLLKKHQSLHDLLSSATLGIETSLGGGKSTTVRQSSAPSSFIARNTNVVGTPATYVGDAQLRTSKLKTFLQEHCPAVSAHERTVLLTFLDRQRNGLVALRDFERYLLGSFTTTSLALAMRCFEHYEATDLTSSDGTPLRVSALFRFFETYAPAQSAQDRVLFVHGKYKDDASTNRELFRQLFKKYAPNVSLQDADRFWMENCGSGQINQVVQVLSANNSNQRSSSSSSSSNEGVSGNDNNGNGAAAAAVSRARRTRPWRRQRYASLQLITNILKVRSDVGAHVSGAMTQALQYMGWQDTRTTTRNATADPQRRLVSLPDWLQFCAELCALLPTADRDTAFGGMIEQLNAQLDTPGGGGGREGEEHSPGGGAHASTRSFPFANPSPSKQVLSLDHAERERVKEAKLQAALSAEQFKVYKRQLNETLRKVCACFFTLSGTQRTASALLDQLRCHKEAIRDDSGDVVMVAKRFRVALVLYGVQLSERDYSLLETHFDAQNNEHVSIGDFGVRLLQQDSRKHGVVVSVCDTETEEQAPTAHPRWARKVLHTLVEESMKTWVPYEHSTALGNRTYWYCPQSTERRWTRPAEAKHRDGGAGQSPSLASKRLDQLLQSAVSRDAFQELCECIQQVQSSIDVYCTSAAAVSENPVDVLCLQQIGLESVPAFLTQGGSVRVAFLDHNRLTHLPLALSTKHDVQLEHLHLSHNPGILSLPATIGDFDNLLSLTCAHGQLKSIDPAIGMLHSLRLLDLGDNQLTRLPPTIGRLTELRKLVVSHNRLDALPHDLFGDLEQLHHLDMSHNFLVKLPDEMATMRELLHLDLRYNSLRHIPAVVTKLATLRVFRIDGNHIEQVPAKVVCALEQLSCFTMQHNQSLCTLHTMRELQAANMQRMYLGHNHISHLALHVDVCKAGQLVELKVQNNNLSFLPHNMEHLTSLRILWIHNNRIEELPNRLPPDLRELRASANRLTRVYTSIRKAKKLEHLDLARNRLTTLPLVIHEMSALVSLRLDGNPFKDKFAQIVKHGVFQTNEDAKMQFVYRKLIDGLNHDDIHIRIDRHFGLNIEEALTQHRDRSMARKRAPITIPTPRGSKSKGGPHKATSTTVDDENTEEGDTDNVAAAGVDFYSHTSPLRRRSKSAPEVLLEECFQRFELCPGVITRKGFRRCVRLIGRLLTILEVQRLCEHVFATFDGDHSGELFYLEFTGSIFDSAHVKKTQLQDVVNTLNSGGGDHTTTTTRSGQTNLGDHASDKGVPEVSALEHDDPEYAHLCGIGDGDDGGSNGVGGPESNNSPSVSKPSAGTEEGKGDRRSRVVVVAAAVKAYCLEALTIRRNESVAGPSRTSGAALAHKVEQQLEADKDQVSKLEDLIRVQKHKAGEMSEQVREAYGQAQKMVRRAGGRYVRGRLLNSGERTAAQKHEADKSSKRQNKKKNRYRLNGSGKHVDDPDGDDQSTESSDGEGTESEEEREREAKFFSQRKKMARQVLRAEKARVAELDRDLSKLQRVFTHARCASGDATLQAVALSSQARLAENTLESNEGQWQRNKRPKGPAKKGQPRPHSKKRFAPDAQLVKRLHALFDQVAAASWSPDQVTNTPSGEGHPKQQGAGAATNERVGAGGGGTTGSRAGHGRTRIVMGELLLVMVKFYKEFGQGRTGMAPAKWRGHLLQSVNRCFQGGYEDAKGDMVAFVLDAQAGMTRSEFVMYVLHTEAALLEANGFQVHYMSPQEKAEAEKRKKDAAVATAAAAKAAEKNGSAQRPAGQASGDVGDDDDDNDDDDDAYGTGTAADGNGEGVEKVQSHRQTPAAARATSQPCAHGALRAANILVDIFGGRTAPQAPVVVQVGSSLATATVEELKLKLQFQVGIPAHTQQMFFRGERLRDADTLASLEVSSGDRIKLLVAQSTGWRGSGTGY